MIMLLQLIVHSSLICRLRPIKWLGDAIYTKKNIYKEKGYTSPGPF